MSEAKDPRGDDHIEELLSQLQGIFGKLSRSEEEESQAKVDPPASEPPPQAASSETVTPAPPVPDAPLPPATVRDSAPTPAAEVPAPPPPVEIPSPPVESPAAEPPHPPADLSSLPMEADKSAVYSLIFYPPNRENEAKTLMEKVETMTPRFTKVAFQIKVAGSLPI